VPAGDVETVFRDSMASLASGVAVLTARRDDGAACGLVATSLAAYSASPPSVLVSIGHTSRCHEALADGREFGVHLLAAHQERLAHVFADPQTEDKFEGIEWSWDGPVPAIDETVAYLRCRRSARFDLYDHTILIGDVQDGRRSGGDPLVYLDRHMGWRLTPGSNES
jgi:flavin reductase (DIM6/NTAB) family NADH-FMN oxidoreductase RutF